LKERNIMTVADRISMLRQRQADIKHELVELEAVPEALRDKLVLSGRRRLHTSSTRQGTQGQKIIEHLKAHPEGQTVNQVARVVGTTYATISTALTRLIHVRDRWPCGMTLRHVRPLGFYDDSTAVRRPGGR